MILDARGRRPRAWLGDLQSAVISVDDGATRTLSLLMTQDDVAQDVESVDVAFVQSAPVPHELYALPHLRVLAISPTWPADSILSSLLGAPYETRRELSDVACSGPITDKAYPSRLSTPLIDWAAEGTVPPAWVAEKATLRVLYIDGVSRSGSGLVMPYVARLYLRHSATEPLLKNNLPMLTDLILTLCSPSLSKLTSPTWLRVPMLENLTLEGHHISEIRHLELLPHLTSLTIVSHSLGEIYLSEPLAMLDRLDITSTSLSRIPAALLSGSRLRYVRLVSLSTYYQDGFPGLENATCLNELRVEDIGKDVQTTIKMPPDCLRGLKVLDLDHFTGSLISFASMDSLERLSCSYCDFPLTAGLGSLPSTLRELILVGPKELPFNLGDLTRLEVLECSSDRLTSLPASLSDLTNLHSLELYTPSLQSLPSLNKLTRLDTLGIFACSLSHVPNIAGLQDLREVVVHSDRLLPATSPLLLPDLPTLQTLSLTRVEDSDFLL